MRSKGLVIEHVSLGQATRINTRRSCSKEAAACRSLRRLVAQAVCNLAAGRRSGPRSTRLNGQFTRLPQSRCPTLAPGTHAGIFHRKKLWHTPCSMQPPGRIGQTRSLGSCFSSRVKRNKQSMLRLYIRRVAGGNGRRKHARGRQVPGTLSSRLGSTTASMAGWLGRSCLSGKWRHGCHNVWMGAGRMPSSLPTRKSGESCCHDLHSKRLTMFARRARAQLVWVTTASTRRKFCSCQPNCGCVSSTCSWLSRPRWSNLCAGHT